MRQPHLSKTYDGMRIMKLSRLLVDRSDTNGSCHEKVSDTG